MGLSLAYVAGVTVRGGLGPTGPAVAATCWLRNGDLLAYGPTWQA